MFPQASVAVQVRVMFGWPGQLPGAVASVKVIVGVPPQLSVAVAVPVFEGSVEAPQASSLSPGQVIVGAVVSFTVMVCVQVALFPQASVAR